MKRTIYIINALLFMGCCLLVTTTTLNVKNINVNSKINYVNSDAIVKEEIVEFVLVEEKVDSIDTVSEDKNDTEELVSSKTKVNEVTKDEPIFDTSNSKNNIDSDNSDFDSDIQISVGSVYIGSMSGYGADIGNFTNSGYNISETIYYFDKTYGNVRILASDSDIPFGTIVEVSNTNVGSFTGIVLDRGPNIGFDKKHTFDLLFENSSEALRYGVSKNAKFEIKRLGF